MNKNLFLEVILSALLLMTSCSQEPIKPQEGLNKDTVKQLEAQLKVGQEGAPLVFVQELGTWNPIIKNGPPMPIDTRVNSTQSFDSVVILFLEDSDPVYIRLTKALRRMLYKDGERGKTQYVNGALAAFLYASDLVEELFKNAEPLNDQKHNALARLILACKEALAQLVENPASYESNKVDEVLADYETKLKTVPGLEVVLVQVQKNAINKIREKSGSTTHNYLQEHSVQAAWKAFKEKVKEAQDKYEVVMGLKAPTAAS